MLYSSTRWFRIITFYTFTVHRMETYCIIRHVNAAFLGGISMQNAHYSADCVACELSPVNKIIISLIEFTMKVKKTHSIFIYIIHFINIAIRSDFFFHLLLLSKHAEVLSLSTCHKMKLNFDECYLSFEHSHYLYN